MELEVAKDQHKTSLGLNTSSYEQVVETFGEAGKNRDCLATTASWFPPRATGVHSVPFMNPVLPPELKVAHHSTLF